MMEVFLKVFNSSEAAIRSVRCENFKKVTGKHLCRSLFLKLQACLKNNSYEILLFVKVVHYLKVLFNAQSHI